MTDPRTDDIAREAARLIETSRVSSIPEAIRAAAETLGYRDAELPGHGRVRKHAQAMSMQALGDVGYTESVLDVLRAAERLMTVLAELLPESDALLVGRAADGHIDAGVRLHVRLYTQTPIGEVAGLLVSFGYDEPAFETVNTRLGRLNRLILDDNGLELVVTRCLPRMAENAHLELFRGRPIKTATLEEIRARCRP